MSNQHISQFLDYYCSDKLAKANNKNIDSKMLLQYNYKIK